MKFLLGIIGRNTEKRGGQTLSLLTVGTSPFNNRDVIMQEKK